MGNTEEQVHKLEDGGVDITQAEHKKEKRILTNEDNKLKNIMFICYVK